jgi:hypothetical protein
MQTTQQDSPNSLSIDQSDSLLTPEAKKSNHSRYLFTGLNLASSQKRHSMILMNSKRKL